MHIDSLKILDLPHDGSNWEIGDEVDVSGKNLLLIGDEGTGKTTMLEAIKFSIERALATKGTGANPQKHPGYETFFTEVSGIDYYEACIDDCLDVSEEFPPESVEEEEDRIYDQFNDESLDAFAQAISEIYGNGIINIFDENFTATEEQLDRIIKQHCSINYDKYESRLSVYDSKNARDFFIETAKKYAKLKNLDEKIVFGNFILILNGIHGSILTDAAVHGHIKITGTEGYEKIEIADLSTARENSDHSEGEITRKLIDAMNSNLIMLLDDPTSGLGRSNKTTYREKIITPETGTQVFAASHDEGLIEMAQNSEDWIVHDLGNKAD